MGGAVSSGRDNNELIDNLMGGNYIRTRCVEEVFRALDRAEYMTPEARDQAYKDLAWRNGPLHLSAPCIYSEVMEGLELRPGLSFLNVGSGTGYLSTLVGMIIGSSGISHGIEVHPLVVEYATKKLSQFLENSPTLDEFDFCEPKYYSGNGLCIAPLQSPYDRVYCGAGCPEEYQNYFKQLIKVGGILIMPLNDNLVQVRRMGVDEWVSRSLLNVSFATLRVPTKEEAADLIKLEEQAPVRLQQLARARVRSAMRGGLRRRHPELRAPPPRTPPPKKACPRRICIPIEDDSDVEGLNALHDLDRAGGAHEMNALLSLVLSMGQNRVAGALRFDPLDSPADSTTDEELEDAPPPPPGGDPPPPPPPAPPGPPGPPRLVLASDSEESDDGDGEDGEEGGGGGGGGGVARTVGASGSKRGVLTFQLRDALRTHLGPHAPATAPATAPAPADTDTQSPEKASTSTSSPHSSEPGTSDTGMPPRGRYKRKARWVRGVGDESDADTTDSESGSEGARVPAEVEIYLGKGGTRMDWEHSTDDEPTAQDKEEKRQKLDSGIGEETTPTSDSSPLKTDSKSDDSDVDVSRPSDSPIEGIMRNENRRRAAKRSRWHGPSTSESSGAGAGGDEAVGGRRRNKRRAEGGSGLGVLPSADARRVRLSILMKRGVKELPLPYALKKYVNLGRCFEF